MFRTQGGRDPLPLPTAQRRPMNGILNKFALKRLPNSYPTTMEPEIGLLMCSLVGIRPNSSCLDPFCGSCSLLAYATIHGASFTVGLDVNKNSEQRGQIMDNFKYLGLEPPTRIIQANAESLLNSKYDIHWTSLSCWQG